jgi:hypothetical protein
MSDTAGDTVAPDGDFHIPEVSTRTILLGSGPRFARDAFGPMLVFYAGWKVSGLLLGVTASTIASFAAYRWERSHDRPGLMARLGLGFVLVQAVVGLLADSAPLTAVLMGWSVWYAVRYFRKSAEWGEAIRLLEAGAVEAGAVEATA